MYDITSLQADADGNIVSIGWTYTNNGGSRSGSVKFPESYGPVPVDQTTKAYLIAWVQDILPEGTSEALDAQIAKDQAAAALDVHDVPVPE